MSVTPYDRNTFLVTSRTRPEIEHLVDLSDKTCSCEGALDFGTTNPSEPCWHIEQAIQFRAKATKPKRRSYSPFALLLCPTT